MKYVYLFGNWCTNLPEKRCIRVFDIIHKRALKLLGSHWSYTLCDQRNFLDLCFEVHTFKQSLPQHKRQLRIIGLFRFALFRGADYLFKDCVDRIDSEWSYPAPLVRYLYFTFLWPEPIRIRFFELKS